MSSLEPPARHSLTAAIGWLELGNPAEAAAELDQIQPSDQEHPDVLEVRWMWCAETASWERALEVAELLVKQAPGRASGWLHRAYALRRTPRGSLRHAWDALLPAAKQFPKEPVIPYNLACYACQMENLEQARQWLATAFKAGEKDALKRMALADADLEPLWDEIRRM